MGRSFRPRASGGSLAFVILTVIGFGVAPSCGADGITLEISNAVGANLDFTGTPIGATFVFTDNGLGESFKVTGSTGLGDSVGLFGTISGSFSYTNASIVTLGPLQTAPVVSSGGLLTITDSSNNSLTGQIVGVDATTLGTGGGVNVGGVINLTDVMYSGTNSDLRELKNDAAGNGGITVISFQFATPTSLSALATDGSDHVTSYSGSIAANVVPEPSSAVLGIIGAMALWGCKLRRSKALAA
jgi:hypothetical protein